MRFTNLKDACAVLRKLSTPHGFYDDGLGKNEFFCDLADAISRMAAECDSMQRQLQNIEKHSRSSRKLARCRSCGGYAMFLADGDHECQCQGENEDAQ